MAKELHPDIQDYLNSICCPETPQLFGFDVTADWSAFNITDATTFLDFITVLGGYPATTVTDFVMSGNNIKCNITGGYELDLLNVTEINLITNELVKFDISSGTLTSAELDYCASVFLTNTVLKFWDSSSLVPITQPSVANRNAINALVNSNGGTSSF